MKDVAVPVRPEFLLEPAEQAPVAETVAKIAEKPKSDVMSSEGDSKEDAVVTEEKEDKPKLGTDGEPIAAKGERGNWELTGKGGKKRGQCFAFKKGACTKGDECKFSHDEDEAGGDKRGRDKDDSKRAQKKQKLQNRVERSDRLCLAMKEGT